MPDEALGPPADLVGLVYELLDAHHDTAEADDLRSLGWRAHLDYLRALQRKARGLLARRRWGRPMVGRRT